MEVLMTAYGSEKYIKESIDSIPVSIPIVIGIDGCYNTLDYLIKIKDEYPNLKILWCPENRGTYITRNTLIENTNDDVLIFLDSDDKYTEDLFKKISENIVECDVIRWSYYILNVNGIISAPAKNSYYLHANGVFAAKRKIFNILGGYKNWRFSADYDLQIRISSNNIKTIKLDDHLMYYRQHINSLSKTVPINKRVEIEKELGGKHVVPVIHNKFEWI